MAESETKLTTKMRRLSVSSLTASDSDDKKHKRRHSKSVVTKERRKSASLPLLDTRVPPQPSTNPLAPPSTERSPTSTSSSSPKNVPHNVYTPYNERGDLLSSFAADFDRASVDFCFQCGEKRYPLVCTVEFTSFQYPDVRIYRPIYSCADCLRDTAEKKIANVAHRVRLLDSAMAFYAKSP